MIGSEERTFLKERETDFLKLFFSHQTGQIVICILKGGEFPISSIMILLNSLLNHIFHLPFQILVESGFFFFFSTFPSLLSSFVFPFLFHFFLKKLICVFFEKRHIGVFGFLECEYTMSVHIEVDCNCAVNGHGMCQPGQTECICSQGWGGFDCNVPVAPLQMFFFFFKQLFNNVFFCQVFQFLIKFFFRNVPMKDQAVSIHSWTFYSFEVPAKCSGVTVAIRETNTAGSLWLYVNAKEAPTLISFDYTEQSTTSALHQIDFIPDFISGFFFFPSLFFLVCES